MPKLIIIREFKYFFRCLLASLLLVTLSACAPEPPGNILIIMLDDFGYHDLGSNYLPASGVAPQVTPELDAFAANATRFSQHYTESTCSPSRAALLSGRYPARSGFTSNGRGLSPELTTLPEQLQQAGYRNHFVGKWHTGDSTALAAPHNQGFATWTGFLNQWMLRERYDRQRNNLTQPTYNNPWLENERGEQRQYEGHLNDILTDEANRFIRDASAQAQPWFLQLSYYAPHEPVAADERFSELYSGETGGEYRALVQQLDSNIGRILQALENNNVDDNTIVVIVSDNGGIAERYPSNLPYAGEKVTYMEGGIRTPMMIRWPESVRSGALSELNNRDYPWAVSIMDLYPTLLSAVNVSYTAESLDGRNLLPLLRTETRLERTLHWEIWSPDGYMASILDRDHRWRLSDYYFNTELLFDLEADPESAINVIDSNSEKAAELRQLQDQWHDEVHRLETTFELTSNNGGGILRGDSLQRSPGFGGYTFAIGVTTPNANDSSPASIIASQRDLLSIYFDAGALEVNIQDVKLEASLPLDGQCHALIISARHDARVSWIGMGNAMNSPIQVIVDNQVQADIVDRREMPKEADFTAPTYIGYRPDNSGNSTMAFPGQLSEPLLFNQRLFVEPGPGQYGIASLNDELCP